MMNTLPYAFSFLTPRAVVFFWGSLGSKRCGWFLDPTSQTRTAFEPDDDTNTKCSVKFPGSPN